jgi:hypothetical protein
VRNLTPCMKIFHHSLSLLFSGTLSAASLQINWSIEANRELSNRVSIPLSAGTSANGDGTLLQLGFYSSATASDPFVGSWIVLATSSIGDLGVNQQGRFSVSTTLVEGSFISPTPGTPLAIRYYDGFTAATSTYFNAASDVTGAWNWVAPGDPVPVLNLQITKLSSVFESGVVGAFQTRISTGIPEPTAMALLLVGVGFFVLRRPHYR